MYAYEPKTGFISDRIRPDTANGLGRRYGYDLLGQLRTVRRYTRSATAGDCDTVDPETGEIAFNCRNLINPGSWVTEKSFTYDANGNRTDALSNPSYVNDRQTAFAGTTFSYDVEGNMVRKRLPNCRHRFAWSPTGELTSFTKYGADTLTALETVTFT